MSLQTLHITQLQRYPDGALRGVRLAPENQPELKQSIPIIKQKSSILAFDSPSFPTSFPSTTPATTAAPDEPRPRPSGIGLIMWIVVVAGNCLWPWHLNTYIAVLVIRFLSALSDTSSAPSPSYVITQFSGASEVADWDTSTRISSHTESARPITSKPGPMFADEQGTPVAWGQFGCYWTGRVMLVGLTYGDHCGRRLVEGKPLLSGGS
jgi:hypothetical protein